VTRLVCCYPPFLLQHDDPSPGPAPDDLASDGESDDAGSDDADGFLSHLYPAA
jgi:hypothetical protein